MRMNYLLDTYRSCLTAKETQQFRREITKQKNSPICATMSTMEVSAAGAKHMAADKFRLVKGQFDV